MHVLVLAEHARVAWVVMEEPWIEEAALIADLSVPLNLRGDERHPFYESLRAERAKMMRVAREQPIWTP